jgi:alkylated DNA nucleotide flippase Atl1
MRTCVAVVVGLALCATPIPMRAWGMDVHRFLTGRAIDGLPPELRAFYAEERAFVIEHAADPDLWRVVDLRGPLGAEDPNHFVDLDLVEKPPFTAMPRDWDAYVNKYGLDKATQMGRLPWRTEEIYNRLVAAFTDVAKGTGPAYAADNARYLSAVLSHYLEDAHVPFHASANYDGQLTNQRGIHARFETDLVLRNLTTLKLAPVTIRPIASIRDFAFDTLIDSYKFVEPVLAADRTATAGRDLYDDGYFSALLADTKPILEKRLGDASSAVASAIVSAWERGGRPALPLKGPKPPVRIRR